MDYDQLASKETVNKTSESLVSNGFEVIRVDNRSQALEKIKELIPKGVSLMNGTSTTLVQIGYIDYLKEAKHGWNNLHEAIVSETDELKQNQLRKQALFSDFYLGSVHALTEEGELVIASATGSQLPHIVNSSPNLIFVVSTKKIVATIDKAIERLKNHVVGLEDERMMEKYGFHTALSKIVIYRNESVSQKRSVRVILVDENLGF